MNRNIVLAIQLYIYCRFKWHNVVNWTNLSSNAIILAMQQDKHGSDQFWILNY